MSDDRDVAAGHQAGTRPPEGAAGELTRMGIDPNVVGLQAAWAPLHPTSAPDATTKAAPPDGGDPAPPPAATSSNVLSRPLGHPQDPPASTRDPNAQHDKLRQLVPESHGLVVPAGWRRLVRATTFGLLAPGAADAVERERHLVARVRTRQTGSRMIAFIAGKGGVGTTTTAIGVALTLATLRNDATVLVDSRSGTGSVGRRVVDVPAPTTTDLIGSPAQRTPLAKHSHLHLVDAPPWHSPVDRAGLLHLLENLRADYQFIALDVGNDMSEAAHGTFARSDQVVVVTAAAADALDATRIALGRIQQVDPYRLATAVIAVVCPTGHHHRAAARALRTDLGVEKSRIVAVPFDPYLVSGRRFHADRLRTATREAYLHLAALVTELTPPPRPAETLTVMGATR